MTNPVRAVVTGGGSGGHVMPALAVARALTERGIDVLYVGSNSGLEESLVAPSGVRFRGISAGKLRRYFSWANVADVVRVAMGVLQALWILGRERPCVVFSKGGFVAFPVVFAAWVWRLPVVAHESDATQGLANRLSAPFVQTLCLGFPDTDVGRFRGRTVFTGAPVRPELLQGDRAAGRALLGAQPDQLVLLVTGGSLGADAVNAVVLESLDALREHGWFVVHVAGQGKLRAADGPGYRAFEFVADGWADLLAAADVVVSRAGANTLIELLALGKPNLLVPLPLAGSRGDQLDNAEFAERAGYSRVLQQSDLDAERLVQELARLRADLPGVRSALADFQAPDAIGLIVDELTRLAPALITK